jgi:formate dehydrogenase subunit gamma
MTESGRTTPRQARVRRFGTGTRWVHRTTALLFGVCLVTAAMLYVPELSFLVGRRQLVMTIHLYCGLALPVPTLLGWLTREFRRDATELNRFAGVDGAWLRAHLLPGADRPARIAALATPGPAYVGGKFNAGQKLYAAAIAGAILVFLGTGVIMEYGQHLGIPDRYRTGATFMHDLSAFAAFFAVAGHLWMAARDPVARAGLRTGYVPTWWAAAEHPRWARPAPETPGPPGDRRPAGQVMAGEATAGEVSSTWASPNRLDGPE